MRLIVFYMILIILTTAANAYALDLSSKRDCVVCHIMWLDDFRTDQETLITFQPGNVLMKDTQGVVSSEEICYSCHDGYVKDSRHITRKYNRHPVFVKPSENVTVPDELPLSVKGEIYCGTCHSAHGKGAASHNNPSGRTKVFREQNIDSSLCEKCHRNEADYRFSNSHPLHTTELALPEKLLQLGSRQAVNKNEIICQTCHRVHGAVGEKILISSNSDSELCVICHEKQQALIDTKHDLRLSLPDEKNINQKNLSETGPCGACHTPHNAAGSKLWAGPVKKGNPASQLCLTCHGEDGRVRTKQTGKYSHPLNVQIPDHVSLPDNLPVFAEDGRKDPRGQIQCLTCHDTHRWDPVSLSNKGGKDVEGDASNSFLRTSNSLSLMCMECHTDKKQVAASDHNLLVTAPEERNIHGAAPAASGPCGACHTPHNAVSEQLWAKELSREGDFATQLCESCHNEKGAGKAKVIGDHNHPVDVDLERSDITMKLPLFDNKGVKTDNGKVLCITCHDPHTWDPDRAVSNYTYKNIEGDASNSFLRISNLSSTMCLECHSEKNQVIMSDHNLSVTAPDEKNVRGSVPAASGPCSACHIPHNAESKNLWAKELMGEGDFATKLCTSCHNKQGPGKAKLIGDNNHPVDVAPDKFNITTALPLFDNEGVKTDNGKMLCLTCHDPHTWDPERSASNYNFKNIEGDASNSFLRITNFPSPDLCGSCHKDKSLIDGTEHDLNVTAPADRNLLGQTVKESGQCGACHLVHNSPNNLMLWARSYGTVSGGEDAINSLCTSCHSRGNIAESKIPPTSTHPGERIVSNILRTDMKKADFTPLFDKDTGKETNSGNISCPSCHNAHQWSSFVKEKGTFKNLEGNATNSFLRNISYNNVCTDCHGLDALFRFKYFHDPDDRVEKETYQPDNMVKSVN